MRQGIEGRVIEAMGRDDVAGPVASADCNSLSVPSCSRCSAVATEADVTYIRALLIQLRLLGDAIVSKA